MQEPKPGLRHARHAVEENNINTRHLDSADEKRDDSRRHTLNLATACDFEQLAADIASQATSHEQDACCSLLCSTRSTEGNVSSRINSRLAASTCWSAGNAQGDLLAVDLNGLSRFLGLSQSGIDPAKCLMKGKREDAKTL